MPPFRSGDVGPSRTRAATEFRWYGHHVAPGPKDAARSPWQEWVIRGSIILLLAIGVGAIWGGSMKDWLRSLGGASSGEGERAKPGPPGGGTL